MTRGSTKARELAGQRRLVVVYKMGERAITFADGEESSHRHLSGRGAEAQGAGDSFMAASWRRLRMVRLEIRDPFCAARPVPPSSSKPGCAPAMPTPLNSRPSWHASHPGPTPVRQGPIWPKGPRTMHIAPYDNQNKPIVDVEDAACR
jgi:5-dehydro-2-deoxygluconokinase